MHAFERDAARFEVLRRRVLGFGFGARVRLYNEDVMRAGLGGLEGVGLVLVDPSCSGSAMLSSQFYGGDRGDPFRAY